MIKISDKDNCCGCGACASICPQKCINMEKDKEGFCYPEVDIDKCINCSLCEKVCPFSDNSNPDSLINAYGAKSKNKEIQNNSSSGGIFSELAHHVLSQNGVVYGVSMFDDFSGCGFVRVSDEKELVKLRGSKYIQSSPIDYGAVENDLKSGRTVLFSGTPCQANGLRKYIRKDYPNLIIVDIICHGVPSNNLWLKYKDNIEQKYKADIIDVSFRSKKLDWKHFGMAVKTSNGKNLFSPLETDSYIQLFLKNYCLRPSCYNCKSKTMRLADITIGDFWGVKENYPDIYDSRGVSLIITRTEKGKSVLTDISDNLSIEPVEYSRAVKENIAEYKSVKKPIERNAFFEDSELLGFRKLVKKYVRISKKKRIKTILRKITNKV